MALVPSDEGFQFPQAGLGTLDLPMVVTATQSLGLSFTQQAQFTRGWRLFALLSSPGQFSFHCRQLLLGPPLPSPHLAALSEELS